MWRRLGFGLLFGLLAFLVGALASYVLVLRFSSNLHDRSVEAAMTSVFFYGPVAGLIGFVAGTAFGGRKAPPMPETLR
jgi:hypothetical protein